MKRSLRTVLIVLTTIFGLRAGSLADDATPMRTGLFTDAKEVFRPLIADPREIQLSLKAMQRVSHKLNGEAAIGDYFGLYRWALPPSDSYLQWSVAGGAFGRFD